MFNAPLSEFHQKSPGLEVQGGGFSPINTDAPAPPPPPPVFNTHFRPVAVVLSAASI